MARRETQPKKPTSTKKPAAETAAETPLAFEDAMDRLETLIEAIESGELDLEDSIGAYEQGVSLVGRCRAVLSEAEQRVEELTDRLDDADTPP